MATYVVCTVEGADGLVGVVCRVDSEWVGQFHDVEELAAMLSGEPPPDSDPHAPREDPGDGHLIRTDLVIGRARALTPSQLRIGYLQHHVA